MNRFDLGGYGRGGDRKTVNLEENCDIRCDFLDLDQFAPEPGSVDEFFLSHSLEYIPIERYGEYIVELRRMLKPGGQLRVVQSDLGKAIELYTSGQLSFRAMRAIVFTPRDRLLQNSDRRHRHQMWDAKELCRDFEAIGLRASEVDAGTWDYDFTDEFYPEELHRSHGVKVPNLGVVGTKPSIPKIIHQTWKTADIPTDLYRKEWQKSWQELDGFTYQFWTDEDNRALIESDYPWFLETYDSYDQPIKRADAARYFILHKHGGVYADLDFVLMRSLEPLLAKNDLLLAHETKEQIGNALMGSSPGHPVMAEAIQRLPENSAKEVMQAAGPHFLTRIIRSSRHLPEVQKTELLYPYPWDDPRRSEYRNQSVENLRSRFPNAIAITHWSGSWLEKPHYLNES